MESTNFTEGTLAASPIPGPAGGGITGTPSAPSPGAQAGSSAVRGPGDVLLRLEGAPGVRFSGLCSVGAEESVVVGRVPQRYAFDNPGRRAFTCRIQKQGGGPGSLRVILLAGGTTRSVQQTAARGGTITVSYAGR